MPSRSQVNGELVSKLAPPPSSLLTSAPHCQCARDGKCVLGGGKLCTVAAKTLVKPTMVGSVVAPKR